VLGTVAKNGFTEPLASFRNPLSDNWDKAVADRESTHTGTCTLSALRRRAQASTQKTAAPSDCAFGPQHARVLVAHTRIAIAEATH
jgi:hypothetical protein